MKHFVGILLVLFWFCSCNTVRLTQNIDPTILKFGDTLRTSNDNVTTIIYKDSVTYDSIVVNIKKSNLISLGVFYFESNYQKYWEYYYYKNGRLSSSILIDKEIELREESYYYNDNYLSCKEFYRYKNGEIELIKEYYKKRYVRKLRLIKERPKSFIKYKNGKLHGETTFYYRNGKKKEVRIYRNGLIKEETFYFGKWMWGGEYFDP